MWYTFNSETLFTYIYLYRVGWNRAISLHPSSPRHSYYRKLLNDAVNPAAVRSLNAIQEAGAHRLVSYFLHTPDNWYHDVRSAISATLVKICFGRDCSADEFPYVSMAERSHEVFNAVAVANSWTVDYLPIRTLGHHSYRLVISYSSPLFIFRSQAPSRVASRDGVQTSSEEMAG